MFLHDAPTHDDAFDSRVSVAEAIARVLTQQAGGRAIALEGSWGTGKSSIVQMVKKRLEVGANADCTIFTFDAWAHRGDPLRRTFILEMFRALRERKWILADDQVMLERTVADLAVAHRHEQTDDKVGSPLLRSLVATVILLVPVGLAMLSSGVSEWMLASLWVVALPIVLWGMLWAMYVLGRIASRRTDPKKAQNRSSVHGWLDRFAAANNLRPDQRVWPTAGLLEPQESGASRVFDRSSVEFREAYEQVAQSALAPLSRRLVIVIDNLDRLDPTEVADVWTAMRLFVDLGPQANVAACADDWRRRVWLLVPYDPEGLRLLVAPNAGEGRSSHQDEGSEAVEKAVDVHGVAESFIDKTFHIRFEAPPLLLADWREHFKGLINTAMPAMAANQDWLDDTYRVASLGFAESERPPTPRQLRLFVNDMAAIVMARGDADSIPLPHIAYYVWLRRQAGSAECVRQELLGAGTINQNFDSVLGPDAALDVAMVLFGTSDKGKAAELLLQTPLLGALERGDGERIAELARGAAFWPAFELIQDEIRPRSAEFARTAICAIEQAKLIDAPYRAASELIKRVIRRLGTYIPNDRVDRLDGDAFAAAISLVRDQSMTRDVVKRMGSRRVGWEKPSDSEQKLLPWASDHAYALVRVLKAARESGGVTDAELVMVLEGADEELIALLAGLKVHASNFSVDLKGVSVRPPILQVWTDLLLPSGSKWPWPQWRSDAVAMAVHFGVAIDWKKMSVAIQEGVAAHRLSTASVASSVLSLVTTMRRSDREEASRVAASLTSGGYVSEAVGVLVQDGQEESAIRWLALAMASGDQFQAMKDSVSSVGARELVAKLNDPSLGTTGCLAILAREILELKTYEPLSHLLNNRAPHGSLLGRLFSVWIDAGQLPQVLSPRLLVKRWEEFHTYFGGEEMREPTAGRVLAAMWDVPELQTVVKDRPLNLWAALMRDALEFGLNTHAASSEGLSERLNRISEDEWLSELKSGSLVMQLAGKAAAGPWNVRVGHSAKEALGELSTLMAIGSEVWSEEKHALVTDFVGALAKEQSSVLGADMLEQLHRGQMGQAKARLKCFRPALDSALEEVSGSSFIRGTARAIIKARDPHWLQWLAEVLRDHHRLLAEATVSERRDLEAALARTGEESSEDVEAALRPLRTVLAEFSQ